MILRTLLPLALLLCHVPAAAAQGKYQTVGAGCPGDPVVCGGNNTSATTLDIIGSLPQREAALEVRYSGALPWLTGVRILTRAPQPVSVSVAVWWPDANGRPGRLAKQGFLRVGTTVDWYEITFKPFQTLGKSGRIFVSWAVPNGVRPFEFPITKPGSTSVHFWRTQTGWSGPHNTYRWALQAVCYRDQPFVRFVGLPRVGATFRLGTTSAKPRSAAILMTGASRLRWGPLFLPFDLGPLGAPACRIMVSGELLTPVPVGTNGEAWLDIPIPNDARLRGAIFFNQWLIPFAGRNALGLVVSNSGFGTIG